MKCRMFYRLTKGLMGRERRGGEGLMWREGGRN